MAFGFPPKYKTDFQTDTSDAYTCMVLAQETIKRLKWNPQHLSPAGFIASFDTGFMGHNLEIKGVFEEGVLHLTSTSLGNGFLDWGRNQDAVETFTNLFPEVKATYPSENLLREAEEFRQTFDLPEEDDPLRQAPSTLRKEIAGGFSLLLPQKGYTITPLLLLANVGVFIAMVASGVHFMEPDGESLVAWGANYKPLTLGGEWWRIITCCFLHIGVLHLVLNMYALVYIGVLLEPLLGKSRFLAAYFLTGITSSLCSLWWHDLSISAGASGAIFGMYGVFLALLTTNLLERATRKALLSSIGLFVGYNLIFGLKGDVDNAAHIGGLLGGIVIGYAFVPGLKQPQSAGLKYGTMLVLALLVSAGTFMAFKNLPNDLGNYQKYWDQFVHNEEEALRVFDEPAAVTQEEQLSELQEGLKKWQQNDSLLNEMKLLNLPDDLKLQNGYMRQYNNLRIQSYELLYKATAENTDRYDARIEATDQEIEKVLKSMQATSNAAAETE